MLPEPPSTVRLLCTAPRLHPAEEVEALLRAGPEQIPVTVDHGLARAALSNALKYGEPVIMTVIGK